MQPVSMIVARSAAFGIHTDQIPVTGLFLVGIFWRDLGVSRSLYFLGKDVAVVLCHNVHR